MDVIEIQRGEETHTILYRDGGQNYLAALTEIDGEWIASAAFVGQSATVAAARAFARRSSLRPWDITHRASVADLVSALHLTA